MCLLWAVFRLVPADTSHDDTVISLPPSARVELALAAVLAPVMCSNLHATMASAIVCVDASERWMAAVSARVPQ